MVSLGYSHVLVLPHRFTLSIIVGPASFSLANASTAVIERECTIGGGSWGFRIAKVEAPLWPYLTSCTRDCTWRFILFPFFLD